MPCAQAIFSGVAQDSLRRIIRDGWAVRLPLPV